ncbi:MAG: tryptophan-rich sensory protein [Ruminococcaceae bacterium]|nr:tryptophan-rich sensory protein [Oscillospiraceae bacterium]
MTSLWSKIKPYLISILTALAVGALAAFLTRDSMQIYGEIKVPPLAPPSILFPIVWTVLYVLMGISAALVYTNREINPKSADKALVIYAFNLILNFAWSIIFFRFRAFFAAFICLMALLITIIKMISSFYKINKLSAYLQIPYLLWVAFAGYLNFGIWFLNR